MPATFNGGWLIATATFALHRDDGLAACGLTHRRRHRQTNGCAGHGHDRHKRPCHCGRRWDVVQRYGGISLIVSASQRCSIAVTVSRMVMGTGLRG